jgi:hypothetical protein
MLDRESWRQVHPFIFAIPQVFLAEGVISAIFLVIPGSQDFFQKRIALYAFDG